MIPTSKSPPAGLHPLSPSSQPIQAGQPAPRLKCPVCSSEFEPFPYNKKFCSLKCWKILNRDRCRQVQKQWYLKNIQDHREKVREWRKQHPEAVKRIHARYYARHAEAIKRNRPRYRRVEYDRQRHRHHRDTLSDSYVARRLGIPVQEAPGELLALKKAHLQLIREQRRQRENNESNQGSAL